MSQSRGISSIGRVRALQARGTGIETPMLHFVRAGAFRRFLARLAACGRVLALVAQLVEHGSNKPRVGGSSPSWSMFLFVGLVLRRARLAIAWQSKYVLVL